MADDKAGSGAGSFARATAAIMALAGIAGAISQLLGALEKLFPDIKAVDSIYRYAVFALLIIVGLYLLFALRRDKSDSSAEPSSAGSDTPSSTLPFAGRDKDTQNLLGYCNNYRLVFLRGDSGVGKSTLIASGLAEVIESSSSFLMVHMRYWGDSWDEGPQRWLADVLSTEMGEHAGDFKLEHPEDFPRFVRHLYKVTSRRLLVVFDQFDDYQVRFREHLYLDEESRYLSPDELLLENPFWGRIAELIEDDCMRCIFVTRSDVVGALSSVRFVEPLQEMDLQRLDSTAASKLVSAQLPRGIMTGPERSLLVRQIVIDLDDGGVLPAQLHAAIEALRYFKPLSFASYALKRLIGIQIDHLARRVAVASKVAGIEVSHTHAILFAMVDARPTPPKAQLRAEKALLWAGSDEVSVEALDKLLNALRERDVVRQVPSEPPQWTLYHDYVASIVKEMQVLADRWTVHLHASHERLKAARGILGRWRALLTPVEQLQLIYHRYISPEGKGRFRFRQYRPLVLWSLLRWLWYGLVVLGITVAVSRFYAQREPNALIARFAFGAGFPSGDEVTALWDLRAAPRDTQDEVLKAMLSVSGRAARFAEHGEMVVHAVVDMNERRRKEVTALMRARCHHRDEPVADEVALACMRFSLALESADERDWRFMLSRWLQLLEQAPQSRAKRVLARKTTRWLTADSAVRWMPPAAGQQLFEGGKRLSQARSSDLVSLQLFSALLSRIPANGAREDWLALQQAVRDASLPGVTDKERRLRRLITWWPIAASLGDDADVGAMVLMLSQLDMHSGDVSAYLDESRALFGRDNPSLLLRLMARIGKLPDDKGQMAALKTLERLMPHIPLEDEPKRRIEASLQKAKERLQPSRLDPPEPADTPLERSRRTLKRLDSNLRNVTGDLEALGESKMVADVRELSQAEHSLVELGAQLEVDQNMTPEQAAAKIYRAYEHWPGVCPIALEASDLLSRDEFLRLHFDADSEAQRFAKACKIGAQAVQSSHGGVSQAASELSAVGYVQAIIKQLEAGGNITSEPLNAKRGDYDIEVAQRLAGRVLAVLRAQPRQLRNAIKALEVVHLYTRTNAQEVLLVSLVTQAQRVDAGPVLPAVVGLLARLYRNQSEAVTLRSLNLLLMGYIDYIVKQHVTDEDAGRDLAVLARIVPSRRDEVADKLAGAMLNTLDRSVQAVLRRGTLPLKDVMDNQSLVTLLRWPTCVGKCRDELIEVLRLRNVRDHTTKLNGLWQVAAWAWAHKIDTQKPAWTPPPNAAEPLPALAPAKTAAADSNASPSEASTAGAAPSSSATP